MRSAPLPLWHTTARRHSAANSPRNNARTHTHTHTHTTPTHTTTTTNTKQPELGLTALAFDPYLEGSFAKLALELAGEVSGVTGVRGGGAVW